MIDNLIVPKIPEITECSEENAESWFRMIEKLADDHDLDLDMEHLRGKYQYTLENAKTAPSTLNIFSWKKPNVSFSISTALQDVQKEVQRCAGEKIRQIQEAQEMERERKMFEANRSLYNDSLAPIPSSVYSSWRKADNDHINLYLWPVQYRDATTRAYCPEQNAMYEKGFHSGKFWKLTSFESSRQFISRYNS